MPLTACFKFGQLLATADTPPVIRFAFVLRAPESQGHRDAIRVFRARILANVYVKIDAVGRRVRELEQPRSLGGINRIRTWAALQAVVVRVRDEERLRDRVTRQLALFDDPFGADAL